MRQRKRPSHQRIPGEASPFMKALQSRVLRFVRRHGVLTPGERALLAVSGGQGSRAVLLLGSRPAGGGARGEEGAVRGRAQALGLPFAAGSGDARGRAARRRESIEEAARNLRFAFLAKEARRLDAGGVGLGPTRGAP